MSGESRLNDVASRVLDGALRRGVKGVRVMASRSRGVMVTYRKGKPDKIQESSRLGVALHLYIDGRYTVCSTNDLRHEALEAFLDGAVAMCQAMTPDPYREMPDPALYAGREEKDLGIHDPAITSQTTEQRKRYAAAAEAAGVQAGGERVIQAEATCEDSEAELYQVHSNGFEGSVRESGYDSYVEVSLQDEGDKRPSGDYDVSSRFGAQLVGPDVVGRKAAENGLVQLGAKKIETARLAMVVENRVASRLISSLLAAASGRALQQKQSFLEGQVGQTFAGALLDLADDPFVPGGWGSRLFDGEGITARRLPLFERGVFRNFYIDTYYGKKLGLPPTTGGRSNVVLTPGEKTPEQLVAGVRRGILVRGFLGGNSNSTTGDFSVGLHGTLIENGALTKAVSEMNIAGNHKEFWKSLAAVGNDPWPHSSMRIPTLLFGEVQFSGA